MSVTDTFGKAVTDLGASHAAAGRRLLRVGWELEGLKFRYMPEKRIGKADQYLAHIMMEAMTQPLRSPENSAILSIFMPAELVHEVGLAPYNVEGFSCYLNASHAEGPCIALAEKEGLSDTLCSYHRTFLGAAFMGIMPKPKVIVYTNIACDANLLTFRRLAELFDVPSFAVDVPRQQSEESIHYVADQLRDLARFLEKNTGRKIDEDSLSDRLRISQRSLHNYRTYQKLRAVRYIPSDLVTSLYCAMSNNLLLGTEEEEKYTQLLLEGIKDAQPKKGKHIYWMHTLPFWSEAAQKLLRFAEDAQSVGDELGEIYDGEFDPDHPYEAMAERLVYNNLNGSVTRRISAGIEHAKRAGADGVIWFNQWGCKHTIGPSQLARKKFEEAGIPTLILDGDGCSRAHGGEGQTSTRIGAFLEMLNADGNG